MAQLGKKIPLKIAPGVNPITDNTNLDTIYYTDSDKVRFQHGRPRKIKGCQRKLSKNFQRLSGSIRSIYSYIADDNINRTIIGTSSRLYVYQNNAFFNITPLQVTTIPIPNSLSTVYNFDISIDGVSTTINTNIITFSVVETHYLNIGDIVKITGVVGDVGGVPNAQLNNIFIVIGVPDATNFQVIVLTIATATASGGGNSIKFTTQQLYITYINHNLKKGDRIKIAGVTTDPFGGIPITSINREFIISNIISPNQFVIVTSILATSLAVGGGAGITIQTQIASGAADQSKGLGYGGGLYGVGLYGIGQEFIKGTIFPRIWSCERYNNILVCSPGNQSGVYFWDGDISIAPVLLTNAPTSVNWVFESHGAICVLGANGDGNAFDASDNQDFTVWAPSPSNLAFFTVISQASTFISQAASRDIDLLFTKNQVFLLQFVDSPDVWIIRELFKTDGLIAPMARVEIEDVIFWVGQGDFYVFDGYTVNILPDNTVKRYFYDNLNYGQVSKVFIYPNVQYNEIWIFFPKGTDNECNDYIIYNFKDKNYAIGTWRRSAAEQPTNISPSTPLLSESNVQNTVSLPNSLSADFEKIFNPFTTLNASAIIAVSFSANPGHGLAIGDKVMISGAIDTNGIPASEINGVQTVININNNFIFEIQVVTPASSNGRGGGNVSFGIQKITINHPGNNFTNGDEILISGAQDIAGIAGININGTKTIRNWGIINNSFYDIFVSNGFSTARQLFKGGPFIEITYTKTGRLFQHESGTDDYNEDFDINDPSTNVVPMNSFIETNYAQIAEGDNNMIIYSIIPDSSQIGNIGVDVYVKTNPQNPITTLLPEIPLRSFTITPTTEKIDVMAVGRQRKYRISNNELGADWKMGQWFEQVKETTPR